MEEVLVSTEVEERTKTVRGPAHLTEGDVEQLGRALLQKARDKALAIRNCSTLGPLEQCYRLWRQWRHGLSAFPLA